MSKPLGRMISADSHVLEPPDLWDRHLPERLRGKINPFRDHATKRGLNDLPAGADPARRLEEQTLDGVSAEVLYPTLGLDLFRLEDRELQEACFQIYNDWLAEYCSQSPDRLLGVAAISVYRPEAALTEIERCRKKGLRGIQLWVRPHPNMPFNSIHYANIWRAAADLDMPLSFHILTGYGDPRSEATMSAPSMAGAELARALVNHRISSAADTLYDLLFYGVLTANPKLKIVFVEFEMGWMPFYLQRWDRLIKRFKTKERIALPLEKDLSHYIENQIFCTILSDRLGARLAIDEYVSSCLWSNDFPHPDSPWPRSREVAEEFLKAASPEVRERILWRNAAALYGLKL